MNKFRIRLFSINKEMKQTAFALYRESNPEDITEFILVQMTDNIGDNFKKALIIDYLTAMKLTYTKSFIKTQIEQILKIPVNFLE